MIDGGKLVVPARLQGVDLVRVLAIVAVIVIHTTPLERQASPIGQALDAATLLNQLSRFAVPFFFTLAGYFWDLKLSKGAPAWDTTWAMASRVFLLFVAWSVVYLLPTDLATALTYGPLGPLKVIWWNALRAARDPVQTLLTGTESHLWFLSSLWCILLIAGICAAAGRLRLLMGLGALLYALALIGKPYAEVFFEGGQSSFNFRNGPFFGLIFFASGSWLRRHEQKTASIGYRLAGPLGLTSIGALLHLLEVVWLHREAGASMAQDFALGTYPFGLGVSWLALRLKSVYALTRVAQYGFLVLGIYASHMIFVNLLKPWDRIFQGNIGWDGIQVLLVLLCSLGLSVGLGRHVRLSWLVK